MYIRDVEKKLAILPAGTESHRFENLMSKKELGVAFGISDSFISKLMAERQLPYFKLGRAVRFRISDVSVWLDDRKKPSKSLM